MYLLLFKYSTFILEAIVDSLSYDKLNLSKVSTLDSSFISSTIFYWAVFKASFAFWKLFFT